MYIIDSATNLNEPNGKPLYRADVVWVLTHLQNKLFRVRCLVAKTFAVEAIFGTAFFNKKSNNSSLVNRR